MRHKFFKIFSFLGFSLLKTKNLRQLIEIEKDVKDLLLLNGKDKGLNSKNVKSQINQDLFVLHLLNWKRKGYFVEFGATNGLELSNTYLLEKNFEWNGILSEPNPFWKNELIKNRKTNIDFNCIWKRTGDIVDFEISDIPEQSKIKQNKNKIKLSENSTIKVKTISLNDLLKKFNALKY